jgi:(2R)-sulfolactate sulfo-lyase subunit alpha
VATECIIHDKADSVGVVVVEDVQPGTEITLWVMDTDETLTLQVLDAVPFGHKIALRDVKAGDAIIKYGHDIGQAVADIGCGRHVHTHNLATKRR